MSRILLAFLLLGSIARAQGLEEWITEVLDHERTGGEQRYRLLDRIAKANGMDRLAERALVPAAAPGVVQDCVRKLFETDTWPRHLERILALCTGDGHRATVLLQVQRAGEGERGPAVLAALADVARGKSAASAADAALRRAAVAALGRVPRRAALEVVIEVWGSDADDQVRVTCGALVAEVLGADTIERARRHLADRPHFTYYDLLRERLEGQRVQIAALRQLERRFLEHAGPSATLEAIAQGDPERRRIASARLKAIAESGPGDEMNAPEFARRVLDAFVALRRGEVQDATTLANFLEALRVLAQEDKKAPLLQGRPRAEVLATFLQDVVSLARDSGFAATADERRKVGSAAVRLLNELGEEAQQGLGEFAQYSNHPDVRNEAIQGLGAVARRFDTARQYVGLKLAEMLNNGEASPAVRRQILSTLVQEQVPVANAVARVVAWLDPADPEAGAGLTESEVRDCVVLLRQAGTDETLAALSAVAERHPKEYARRFALEEGLLPWAQRNGKEPDILARLTRIAVERPEEAVRVVEALGKGGTRNSLGTLNEIAASEGADATLKAAVVEAKLKLAERMATLPWGSAPREDQLRVAVQVLEEEGQEADGEKLGRILKIARDIAKAGDAQQIPVGTTRYRLAKAFQRQQPDQRAALLDLFEDAAQKAAGDNMPAEVLIGMLREYCTLLLEKRDSKTCERAVVWSEKLADLLSDNRADQVRYLLDAAECCVTLARRDKGLELVKRADTPPLESPAKARAADLRTRLEALPQ